ncbi:FAD-dependent oxidoreductase [Advenella sp. WQ 585]|uniref:FAD-dependent oxidoreductase n=1 Tax=Advenella mandrilli TaxID=2800330 RepID=A0ABS1E9Y9_9BURK|nr:FAD-dependent oxidoreductase [Advenella mandrilli]MBK1779690.1 FAD-dependent oxidoreductase [Advenella mandrilli]
MNDIPVQGQLHLEHLFKPVSLGNVQARNRVSLVATLTNYAENHLITPKWTSFLVERAKGGVGTLITELIATDPAALAHGGIVIGYDDRNQEGFKRTAAEVREAGGLLLGQLWHPGRQQLWAPVRSPKGISEKPDAFSWTVPHVMSTGDLRELINRFVEVAQRLYRAGFNGVELHGAHGYLLTQLLSPWSNDRDDEFGGSVENRTRFIREIAQGIRETCGADFIVGLKMPGDEGVRPGIDPEESRKIAERINVDNLLDYLAISQGNFSLSLENHVPDIYFNEAHFKDLAAGLRPHVNPLPLMSVGRITRPELAEQLIGDGVCDMVGLSRALMADANWVKKAEQGQFDDIRPATYSNFSWGMTQAGQPILEENNPEMGESGESGWQPGKSSQPKKVSVVGSGPAGLEAAWVLAARGHKVTLYGKSHVAGGALRLISTLPTQVQQKKIIDWQVRQAEKYGVEFQMGEEVKTEHIIKASPEVVVLATGSVQSTPEGLEGKGLSLKEAMEHGLTIQTGKTIVLYDLDQTAATYAAADSLSERNKVILVTPRSEFAKGVNYCSQIGVMRRLYGSGVTLIPATEIVDFKDSAIVLRNVYTGIEQTHENVDYLLWSSPRKANSSLIRELVREGIQATLIGDCMSPRNLLCAIHEGRALAMSL